MTEFQHPTRMQRFWHWFNNAKVPMIYVNWGLLALCVFVVVFSIVRDSIDFWFWVVVAGGLWTVFEIVRYYWRKRHPVVEPPLTECDHSCQD